MRKLVAALACRAGGSRLYGKPLQNLDWDRGLTVLDNLLDCLALESSIHEIVLGVAVGSENAPFHEIARSRGFKSIEGDEIDVLSRLIQCGEAAGGTDVFRVTTESPFVYFEAVEEAWARHVETGSDMTTVHDLPDGCQFEIITLETLRRSHRDGDDRHRSELCSLYVNENPGMFQVEVLPVPERLRRSDLRLTVDYPEDLMACRAVFREFSEMAPRIPLAEIVAFLDDRQDLRDLLSTLS